MDLSKYIAEHVFRWNTRELDDGQRVEVLVRAGEEQRMTSREQVG